MGQCVDCHTIEYYSGQISTTACIVNGLHNVIVLIQLCYFYYYSVLRTWVYLRGTQILSTINLSDVTSKFPIAAMLVLCIYEKYPCLVCRNVYDLSAFQITSA